MHYLRLVFFLSATAILTLATFLALVETNAWWVRMTDFPRLQYLVALLVVLALLGLSLGMRSAWRFSLGAALLVSIAYNSAKLYPYPPHEGRPDIACTADQTFSVMVANVRLGNRQAEELLRIVRDREPDLFLALETDAWWNDRLAALSGEMPYSVERITGGYFGMHLLSRLPLDDTEVVFPVEQDTPVIFATVNLPSGDEVRVIGLHPRPPHPGQSSIGRDAQLMWTALRARDTTSQTIVAGDFNAVPWESSVERLQRVGALIDPRQMHGFMPTYDAQSWWMSWPLDQVLHQNGLTVLDMAVLPGFGSDHYPIEVTMCHEPTTQNVPPLAPDDLKEARDSIALARRDGAEDY